MRLALLATAVLAAGTALSVYGATATSVAQPPVPADAPPHADAPRQTTTVQPKGRLGTTLPRPDRVPIATVPAGPAVVTHRSAPVSITIASLDISSGLGPARALNADGTIDDAPLSGAAWSLPWWYKGGPAPGQLGSAVILGHVDSARGAGRFGVFFKLGALLPGARISVTLANGSATNWVVTSDRLYPDDSFPDALVYSRSGPATLRLVTCGGGFDWKTHGYTAAVVITARLVNAS